MKVTIERATLLKGLSHAQSVVERRNTIPILANIRLSADGDSLSLTATDMDLSIVEEVEVSVTTGGGATAPAHMLYDIARDPLEKVNLADTRPDLLQAMLARLRRAARKHMVFLGGIEPSGN